jgi:hypothetical protein
MTAATGVLTHHPTILPRAAENHRKRNQRTPHDEANTEPHVGPRSASSADQTVSTKSGPLKCVPQTGSHSASLFWARVSGARFLYPPSSPHCSPTWVRHWALRWPHRVAFVDLFFSDFEVNDAFWKHPQDPGLLHPTTVLERVDSTCGPRSAVVGTWSSLSHPNLPPPLSLLG